MQRFKTLRIIQGWIEIKCDTELGFVHINVGHLAWLVEISEVNLKYISIQFLLLMWECQITQPHIFVKVKKNYWNFHYICVVDFSP